MKQISWLSLSLATFGCLIPLNAKAQVTPDGTTSTTVNQEGNNFTIEQGDRVGDNLFHSFNEFSVPTLGSAVFNNAGDIANIFSRVTGSSISNIDGLLGANGAANLYLINPNGIIFGENASFNLGGSFFASTADSLLFEGDAEFSAVNPQAPPLLEVSIPIGARFRDNPGDIEYNSISLISEGATFTLAGGNLNLNSALIFSSANSRLELGGLTNAGNIQINQDGSLGFPDDVTRGDITFTGSQIGISFLSSGGGTIAINGRNVTLDSGLEPNSSTVISTGIPADADASGVQAGDIIINATETFSADGGSSVSNSNSGIGNTGAIEITAQNISFSNGSIVASFNNGVGNLGDILLTADEDVSFNGVSSGITNSIFQFAEGNSSNILIDAKNIFVTNGASILSQVSGMGNSGEIDLNGSNSIFIEGLGETVLFDGTVATLSSNVATNIAVEGVGSSGNINLITDNLFLSTTGTINTVSQGLGNAGDVNINANNISLLSSGEISASAFAAGSGGDINIDADNITIDGQDESDLLASRISSSIFGDSEEGNGGDITIDTNSIAITNGGELLANTIAKGDGGNITVNADENVFIGGISEEGLVSNVSASVFPDGEGNGGDINISSANFSINGKALLTTSSEGQGNAGNITIDATNSVFLDNSFILSNVGSFEEVAAVGDVGSIQINAREIALTNTAQIQAGLFSGTTGNSGTVVLNAEESISFTGENTGIFTNNEVNSIGDASNARLNAPIITLDDGAVVQASNSGEGNGGNVAITADNLTLGRNNSISGSTVSGTGGIVDLQIAEDLILLSGNEISAQAFDNANGGNLTIDTELIIAFAGNNDIIANASQGNGGNINITTESLFGIAERPLNPFTNDINASSDFGLQGDIAINTPEVDPTSGLINLPSSVGNASDQISQNPCQQGVGSEFTVTGKGGLPPSVNESFNSESARVGLIEPVTTKKQGEETTTRQGEDIDNQVPAQGWVFNEQGEVTLTAYSPSGKNIQRSEQSNSKSCSSKS